MTGAFRTPRGPREDFVNFWCFLVYLMAFALMPRAAFPAAAVFSGSDVKILKDNLDMNGKGKILSGTTDPTSVAVSAPIGALYIHTSNGNLYRKLDAGSSTNWVQVGSGASGKNYITNTGAEANVNGATAFADAAGTSPVDGTGGSPTMTITRTTSSPMTGVGSYLITKDASNRQGEGISWAFTMDRSDFAKPLRVSFNYELGSGTFVSGDSSDLRVWVYDVTNSALIQVAPYTIQAGTVAGQFRFNGTFQTSATGTSYRLIVHQATTSAAAYTFKLDDIYVGPDAQSYGAAISDWTAYTPTFTGFGTVTNIEMYWRRVGDSIQLRGKFQAGTVSGATARMAFPSGITLDTAKVGPGTVVVGTLVYSLAANTGLYALISSGETTGINFSLQNGTQAGSNALIGSDFANNSATLSISTVSIPVSGWSSTVLMSNDTDTRVVAAKYTQGIATAVPDSATVFDFPTKVYDTHGAVTTGASWKFTVPVPGKYRMTAWIPVIGSAVNAFTLEFRKNGTGIASLQEPQQVAASFVINNKNSTVVDCVAGDTLDVRFSETVNNSSFVGSQEITIERISGPSAIAATETVSAKYTGASTAATPNSGTVFDYDTKVWDTHGAVTTGAAWKFTAPISGRYAVSASLAMNASVVQGYTMTVYHNTTAKENGYVVRPTALNYNLNANVSTVLRLLAGDYIQVKHSVDVATGSFMVAGPELQYITIDRVGNY